MNIEKEFVKISPYHYTSSIIEAIASAKADASEKFANGKLFKADDDSDESQDFTDGDPETLYTIAALYGQYVTDFSYDKAVDEIVDALAVLYPEYL